MSLIDLIKAMVKGKEPTPKPEVEFPEAAVKQPTEPQQITLARTYIGLQEVRDKAKLIPLLGINPAETAWCAAFVNAIEKKCGRAGTGKLNARSFLKYGTVTKTPVIGDIVVFKRGNSSWQGHVGYYMGEDANTIHVLGGNQGDSVCLKHYAKKDLLGYRRP